MGEIIDVEIGGQTPADRVRLWKRLLDEQCMGVECRNAGDDLRASLQVRAGRSGPVIGAIFTRQTLARTPQLIRQADEELVLLAFVREGTHVVRQGHETALLEGCGTYVLDSSRPFEVDFASDQVVQATFHVPKSIVTKRIGVIDHIAFGPEAPLQKLLATFAIGIAESSRTLDDETLDALVSQMLDLFALMVAQRKGEAVDPSTHRAGMLVRLKAYINAHLRDEDLTIEGTARALGISSRYVNALLAADATSFGRYVLDRRLQCARRDIMDPRRAHRQVTEVAFDWGFRNPSHFGRVFKERYGLTPRDAKHRDR